MLNPKLPRRFHFLLSAVALTAILFATLLPLVTTLSMAQSSGGPYQMTQSVVAGGGGGPSTGSGSLSIAGTAGQPATGELSQNPPFTHRSGFWYGSVANSPTAAAAEIKGQVVTADGAPLAGVTISLAGSRALRAITNASGCYAFSELEIGGFYTATPARANYVFGPASRSFSLLANQTDTVFTATAVGPDANPLDSPEFFVRQQYLDFLSREPDQGGLDYWSARLRACNNDAACVHSRSIGVSAAFFIEQEFQRTGSFVYRMYKASFGRQPNYGEFLADRVRLVGGATLAERQQAFADEWIARDNFRQLYPDSMSASEYVNLLFDRAGLHPYADERRQQTEALASGKTRAAVVRDVIEIGELKTREYNPSFVLMQYFGYLRRDPDQGGYNFWLNELNNRDSNYGSMVCAFITSQEYQQRFSQIVSHANGECSAP